MELNSIQMMRSLNPVKTPNVNKSTTDDQLKETCHEFESLLLEQMLKSMRKTVNKTGLIKGGMAEDIFEDMLYEKYAEKDVQLGKSRTFRHVVPAACTETYIIKRKCILFYNIFP